MSDIFLLHQIANIRLGHPFRGSIKQESDGNVNVVQVRDTTSSGAIIQDGIIKTILSTKKQPDWLQPGDVLFVAKGSKHYAVVVQDLPEQTVCSPHFYLVRLKPEFKECFMPEFVCWQLNQQLAQRYFKSTAEGSHQLSIRKQILEEAPIRLLPMEKQGHLTALYLTAMKEREALQQLIENRQKQLDAIAFQELDAL